MMLMVQVSAERLIGALFETLEITNRKLVGHYLDIIVGHYLDMKNIPVRQAKRMSCCFAGRLG